jgi:tetratricopeptide (TPR) repeat protein
LLREYGGKRLGYRAFQAVCEAETGRSLEWFFDQWVRSGKYLDYRITSTEQHQEGQRHLAKVKVERKGTIAMPIPVLAVFEDGSRQVKYTDRLLAINRLQFESRSPLEEVILDPEGALAMLDESLPLSPEQLIRQIRALPYYQCEEDSRSYYSKATDLELEDLGSWNRLGMILFDQGHYQYAFHAFENVLTLDPPETYKFRALVWMGHLKDLLRQREEALRYYREALQAAQDQTITHSQYGMKLDKEYVEERLKTPFEW